MNFEAVIGLEIHIETKSKTKMFSSAPNAFSTKPNTNVNIIDMAFPGTMPLVNKQSVINAIRICNALHMTIDNEIWFDRKNYFYSDLPKGYQITQQFRPIGKDGYVEFETDNGIKRVNIERAHMEEDTCKQFHMRDYTLLDYNRAGVPLIEIVSRPEIKNGFEAMKYVETIRNIVIYSDVSDGKMEEGSLRCDVNISIMPVGSSKFGTKVEIKNLNSTANIQKAVDFEIERQSKLILKGIEIAQETRRWDETKKETVLMRVKTDAVDYKYFTDPNIAPVILSEEFIKEAIDTCPELLDSKKNRYQKEYGLSAYDTDVLLSNRSNAKFFENVVKHTNQYKLAANWITVDIQSYLNKNALLIENLNVDPKGIAFAINAISEGKISSKQGREFLMKVLEENADMIDLINKSKSSLISDETEIRKLIEDIITLNPQSVIDYKAGKDRAVGFLVGQLMKKTGGKINAGIANKLLIEILKTK